MTRLIATFFYVGYLSPASGTWGSLAALPAAWVLHVLGGPIVLTAAAVGLFFLGLSATRSETTGGTDHDPSEIVVDEVVGQWIALIPVSIGAAMMGIPVAKLWPGVLAAFLAFRLFDIWKPWIIGHADARGDALGVMLDDVWAGVFAAILVVILAIAFHRMMA